MAFEKFNLSGKTALITGAAGLLGIEHAAALLESGAQVVMTDIGESALQLAHANLTQTFDATKIITKVMDVTSPQRLRTVAEELWADGFRIDIFVNNAAIDPKVKGEQGVIETSRLENFPFDQLGMQVAVGLIGAFLCSQVFGTKMAKDGKGGVILNISSDLSVFSPDQRLYSKEGPPVKKRLLSYATSMACSSVRRLVACCRVRSGRRQSHIAGICMKIFEQSHAPALGRHLDDGATTGEVLKLGDGQGKT